MNPDFKGRRVFGTLLLVFGLISLWAALTLSTEGYYLLKDGTQPSCNINPFFSCGNVMQSDEARAFFGVPNYFWGLIGWGVVSAVGAAMLKSARPLTTIAAGVRINPGAVVAFPSAGAGVPPGVFLASGPSSYGHDDLGTQVFVDYVTAAELAAAMEAGMTFAPVAQAWRRASSAKA